MKYLVLLVLLFTHLMELNARDSFGASRDSATVLKPNQRIYEAMNIVRQKLSPGRIIKVVVIDDGFRLTHKALKDYIFDNIKDIDENFQDDDQNGVTDDIHGWDVADSDNNVSVLKGNEERAYHGTYIAGIITEVFSQCFGAEASNFLKIIPVKALSDHARNSYLAYGYKALKYACSLEPDIICCAWSGGFVSDDERILIQKEIQKGTIIIGAAGNLNTEMRENPASLNGVLSVASLDTLLHKSAKSNFSPRVDLAAPGEHVYGPFPSADNAYIYESGTSPATAIITGCIAILKAINPVASSREITDAIMLTAAPLDNLNLTYGGKLGAGIPNMSKAIEAVSNSQLKFAKNNPQQTKGKIFYKKRVSPNFWKIDPFGAYKGIHIYSESPENKGVVSIYSKDSLVFSDQISKLSRGIYIPHSAITIKLQPNSPLPKEMLFSYYMETIDSTTLFCRDIQNIDVTGEGTLTDNSGNKNYANNSACKWQLVAPAGKKIRIEVDQIDTQPNIDYLWFFDGTSTLVENLLAKFSGSNKPPEITSLSDHLLLWFVTDKGTTGKGWSLRYKVVD